MSRTSKKEARLKQFESIVNANGFTNKGPYGLAGKQDIIKQLEQKYLSSNSPVTGSPTIVPSGGGGGGNPNNQSNQMMKQLNSVLQQGVKLKPPPKAPPPPVAPPVAPPPKAPPPPVAPPVAPPPSSNAPSASSDPRGGLMAVLAAGLGTVKLKKTTTKESKPMGGKVVEKTNLSLANMKLVTVADHTWMPGIKKSLGVW